MLKMTDINRKNIDIIFENTSQFVTRESCFSDNAIFIIELAIFMDWLWSFSIFISNSSAINILR